MTYNAFLLVGNRPSDGADFKEVFVKEHEARDKYDSLGNDGWAVELIRVYRNHNGFDGTSYLARNFTVEEL